MVQDPWLLVEVATDPMARELTVDREAVTLGEFPALLLAME
jgi:hypothetical protein